VITSRAPSLPTQTAPQQPGSAVIPARPRRRLTWNGRRIDWSAYLFVLPFLIPFFLFVLLAIAFGIYVSFTSWGIVGNPKWIGLTNYLTAFSDPYVSNAFLNTLKYALIIVPGVTIFALIFAIYVNQRWPLYGVARTVFFSSNVVSSTVIGLVWVWILDTQLGILNRYLGIFGIPQIPWLTDIKWSIVGVGLASVWWDLGFSFVLFLAALQDIPSELVEVAEMDGANPLQVFWYVTLPLIRSTLSMVVTLQLISTMQIFSQVYVMTDGGPASSTQSIIYVIYRQGIQKYHLGYAAAMSMILFFVILIVTVIQRRLIQERY
jgi:multiple sugar transport system permease protein